MFSKSQHSSSKKEKLIISLFLPYIVSLVFFNSPISSYLIAWTGSLFIFYCSIFSSLSSLNSNEGIMKRVMRPIVLVQIVFAGFMCCTSIFYFLDHIGYEYFTDYNRRNFVVNSGTYELANCQRYCVLAHACLVVGLTWATKKELVVDYRFRKTTDQLLIPISIIAFIVCILFSRLHSLLQFSLMIRCVAEFSGTLALVKGLYGRNVKMVLFAGGLFLYELINSSVTGYKEGVIIQVILLLFLLFPYYKKLVLILSVPVFAILLYVLPTLVTIIRANVWTGETSSQQARSEAYQILSSPDQLDEIKKNNWDFLKDRFSEVGMFTQFVNYVPFHHDYYAFEILENSIIALIPRALWENKPDTEKISMQRVYESGVVNRLSNVSAKTRPIVDGYLSGGTIGICMVMLVYGLIAQTICNQAERYFGGYEIGCIIFFNGIFQQLWRGNNLEFLINNVVYGYVLMLFTFHVLRTLNILVPEEKGGLCN